MASRISNGGSYGITAKQARVIRMISEGKPMDLIMMCEFHLDPNNPDHKKQIIKMKGQITRWTHNPKVMECYRAIIKESLMYGVAKANRVLEQTMDSDNEWARMQAANTYLARYGDLMMGENTHETVIRIEGMPTMGAPKLSDDNEGVEVIEGRVE